MVDRRVFPQTLPTRRQILEHFRERDPKMAQVIQEVGPFLLKRNRNYFVVLCRSIVSQQISTRAADTIYIRFRKLFDGKAPTPQRVAGLPEDTLRAAGLSRQKAAYLKDLGRRFLDGTLRPRQLNTLDNEAVIDRLTQVHGIGRWTAEMFLIFNLSRPDVLPLDDLGLIRAISINYFSGEPVTRSEAREVAANWEPWRTVATWYMWRSLDPLPVDY